ncbi:DUF2746 domain-containing protein [Streptomyces sp. NBC_01198]|uniref:DUF2746 domain-containing protein n=1 Tax=Streptomyces sp. NBC_01198 TaxID=2903769 RepID=UPI002E0D16F4|nr:DUF2746 domain-containing protein [Streptomyces sp. NBC_01198]
MINPDVQVSIITAGGVVGTAALGLLAEMLRRNTAALAEVREHTQEARDQVANTHTTNLRDDLDRVIDGLDRVLEGQARHDEALNQHGRDIGGLREEVAHERRERLALAERLDDHVVSSRS